jgi:chromosome partitioning protein
LYCAVQLHIPTFIQNNMPTIAFLSQKGGAGKTTLATCVARQLQLDGHEVILIDADPQGSARDWRAATDRETVLVVGLDRPTLDKDIKALSDNGKKWVIIDGAPRNEAMTLSAIKAADLVLIPVQPSPYDVWASEDLVSVIKARQEVTDGKPKAAFVISRVIRRTELSRDVYSALDEMGLPVLQSDTTQRQIYPKAAAEGLTPADIEPKGEAAKEIQALVKEISAQISINN